MSIKRQAVKRAFNAIEGQQDTNEDLHRYFNDPIELLCRINRQKINFFVEKNVTKYNELLARIKEVNDKFFEPDPTKAQPYILDENGYPVFKEGFTHAMLEKEEKEILECPITLIF